MLAASSLLPAAPRGRARCPEQNAPATPHSPPHGRRPRVHTISTGAGQPLTLTLADLKALPQQTLTVHNAHQNADETYPAAPCSPALLAKAGIVLSEKTEHPHAAPTSSHAFDKYPDTSAAAEVHPAHKATSSSPSPGSGEHHHRRSVRTHQRPRRQTGPLDHNVLPLRSTHAE